MLRSLSLWVSSLLLLLISRRVGAISRLRLSALRIGLSPASRGLAIDESYLLRDAVQCVLEDFLLRNSPNKQTPSSWPDITSIGLERILENSVSSDGILRLSVDGLVYFSFSGGDKSVPTNDGFSKYLQEEILTPGVLLEAIATTTSTNGDDFPFQNFTRVGLWDDFFEIPTSTPTASPTMPSTMQPTSAPTILRAISTPPSTAMMQPTSAPTILRTISTPTAQINSFAEEDIDDSDSTIIGVAIAGGIALFLTSIVCICHQHNKPLQKVSEGSTTHLQPHAKGNPIPADRTLSSDEVSNLRQSKGDLESEKNSSGVIADVTMDIDDMSDESFGDETFEDDTGFPDAERIQPDIVAPKRQDSFQHRVYSIQKDMMESSAISKATTAKQPKSLLGLPPSPTVDGNCLLEPTDLSAASLAEAGTLFHQSSRLSDIERPSLLVPKPTENIWGRDRKTAELSSAEDGDDSVYSGWDPDDASMVESEDVFLTSTVPNPAEQSLLHHSVRFESYKMQRLRTPESKKGTSHF